MPRWRIRPFRSRSLLTLTTRSPGTICPPPKRSLDRLASNGDLKVTMSEQDLHSTFPPANAGGDLIRLRHGSHEAVVSQRIGRLISLQDFSDGNVDDIVVQLRKWPAK